MTGVQLVLPTAIQRYAFARMEKQAAESAPGAACSNEDEVQKVEDGATAGEARDEQAGDEASPSGEQVGHVKLAQVEGDARQAQDDRPGRQRIKVVRV